MTLVLKVPWEESAQTTTTRRVTLSTDDIESILCAALGLQGDKIDFDWRIGQWVELVVSTTKTTAG